MENAAVMAQASFAQGREGLPLRGRTMFAPLRDNLCRPDTSGAPRSAYPAAQRVQFAVAVQNIRASELRGTGIPQGTLSCPSGNSPCVALA